MQARHRQAHIVAALRRISAVQVAMSSLAPHFYFDN
jgi:hypothetical protein